MEINIKQNSSEFDKFSARLSSIENEDLTGKKIVHNVS